MFLLQLRGCDAQVLHCDIFGEDYSVPSTPMARSARSNRSEMTEAAPAPSFAHTLHTHCMQHTHRMSLKC